MGWCLVGISRSTSLVTELTAALLCNQELLAAATSPALAAAELPPQPGHPGQAAPLSQCLGAVLDRAGEGTAPPQAAVINIWKLLAALAIPSYPRCASAIHVPPAL